MTHIMRIDEWMKINSPKWTSTTTQDNFRPEPKQVNRNSFNYNGYMVTLDHEDATKVIFHFGNCEITVNKRCEFDSDTRYVTKNGIYYDNVEFDITDGKAVYAGCSMAYRANQFGEADEDKKMPEHINDKFYIYFPKLQQILTSEEEFERAVSYIAQWSENDFGEFLKSNNNGELPDKFELKLSYFFEGYFFNYLGVREICDFKDL